MNNVIAARFCDPMGLTAALRVPSQHGPAERRCLNWTADDKSQIRLLEGGVRKQLSGQCFGKLRAQLVGSQREHMVTPAGILIPSRARGIERAELRKKVSVKVDWLFDNGLRTKVGKVDAEITYLPCVRELGRKRLNREFVDAKAPRPVSPVKTHGSKIRIV